MVEADASRPRSVSDARDAAPGHDDNLGAPDEDDAGAVPQPARPATPMTHPPVDAPRSEVPPSHVLAAAGTAIVTAARMGRLLGLAGWRIARQLPGAPSVERETQRLQDVAVREVRRMLDLAPATESDTHGHAASPEEHRAAMLFQTADPGRAPLRSAMSELLERSVQSSRRNSGEYLYGTIISQLVPDEARILAALSDGSRYAAADLISKARGRGGHRLVLANASTVGRAVGVATPDNVPTYLTRLHGFGLIDFGSPDDGLGAQYDILAADDTVRRAREAAEAIGHGSVRLERKTVLMSQFGREFWTASDPSQPALPQR